MKKIFAVALIISVALVSCKKSSTPGIGNSGIQATIGNTTTVFNVLAYAYPSTVANYYDNTDSVYEIELYAYNSASSQPYLDIYLYSTHPIVSGAVFSDTAVVLDRYNDPEPALQVYLGYDNDPNNTFTSFGTASVFSSPTTLTLTARSATSISGTFQGNLYVDNDSTGLKQTLTNGKFIVPVGPTEY